jgi:hypothetical protein
MSTYATEPPGLRREGDVRQRETHFAMKPEAPGLLDLGGVRPTWRRPRKSSTGI